MAGQKENSCERRDKLLRAIQISFQLGNSLKEFAVALPARQLAENEPGMEKCNHSEDFD